jgi:hypothetical protein
MGLVLVFMTVMVWITPVSAAIVQDLAKQPVTEIRVSLGTEANELKFVPNQFDFQAGKRYKLALS